MTATIAPPSMSAVETIGRARRTRIRRRAAWFGSGAAGAVAVAAVAVAATASGRPVGLVAGGPPSVAPTAGSRVPAPTLSKDGQPVWPTGPDGSPQGDRTARAGTKYDEGQKLLTDLVSAVPAGYDVSSSALDSSHQAQFEDRIAGKDIWSYLAYARVSKDGGAGRVAVEVHAAGNTYTATGCALTQQFWGLGGHCRLVSVNGVQIGVVDRPDSDNRFDQWASYRYADGTVVFVAQGRTVDGVGLSSDRPLTALPYTLDQLAALSMNASFHVG